MEDLEEEIPVVVVDKLECFCGGFVLARGASGTWAVLRNSFRIDRQVGFSSIIAANDDHQPCVLSEMSLSFSYEYEFRRTLLT